MKYAAATALSLPLMIPGAVNAQAVPMSGTSPLANQPAACEQSQNLAALNDCLAIALSISDHVQNILIREAGLVQPAFDAAMAAMPRSSARRVQSALQGYEQANIDACQISQNSASAFNTAWQGAIDAHPIDFDIDGMAREMPYIYTTPDLRRATRAYVNDSAECLATSVDKLKFIMEQTGNSTLQVRNTTAPLYNSIHSYRTFNTH